MKLKFSALVLIALTGCADKQVVIQDPVERKDNEFLIYRNSFDLKDDTGKCIYSLYLGSSRDNITSLLKTEYCLRGALGSHTYFRWYNDNNDDIFEKMCWKNTNFYVKEPLLDFPEVCFSTNIPIIELVFFEKGKYVRLYSFPRPLKTKQQISHP